MNTIGLEEHMQEVKNAARVHAIFFAAWLMANRDSSHYSKDEAENIKAIHADYETYILWEQTP